jgi:hypothetical protein
VSESVPDNSEPGYDAADIDEGLEYEPEPQCPDGPNDFAGYEVLCVLRTPGGRFTATKSYRPDPTRLRTAVKAADYNSEALFLCTLTSLENLEQFFELLQDLSTDPGAFIIRGMLADWGAVERQHRVSKRKGFVVYRRSVKVHSADGYFSEWDRKLQMLDLDEVSLPDGMSVVSDPETCVKWAVDHLLPPEFGDVSFVYQLSSSAGLTKLENELNVHLWFITEKIYSNDNLRAWGRWWNAKQQLKIIDPALFTAVQPHYTSAPELLDGLIDPLAGGRLGLVYRPERTVCLIMPPAEEFTAELKSRQKRATSQYSRARKSEQTGTPRRSQPDDDDTGLYEEPTLETDGDAIPGGPYFDAIRLGPGWRGYLMAIGFEGHVRTQIRAAIGSYFYEYGSLCDRHLLKAEIESAVEDSPFLDCGEPWSRPRQYARDYLSAPSGGDSNVDEMITAIAALQADKERLANEQWEPTWQLPTLTAVQAFAQIEAAVGQVMKEVIDWKARRRDPLDAWILFQKPPRTAVNCSTGTGKTEAMITGIVDLLRVEQTARVAIAVPTHKLGLGLAERINTAYGSEIAAEWYGTDHPDPLASDEKMCRLAESARELVSLGGKLQFLCSRRREHVEYCRHHPTVAGAQGCGYQRQQTLQARNRARVWVVPATMLSSAPPDGLKRVAQLIEGDFDLLVIDEAPWFNLVPQDPAKLPVEWFSPEWWARQESRATDGQRHLVVDTLAKIYAVFAGHRLGEVPAIVLEAAGITSSDVRSVRRTVWRFKVDLRRLVKPGSKSGRIKKALSSVAPRNQRVVAVVEALYALMLHVSGKLAPSAVELIEENGIRHLALRRRQDINEAWLKAPTLYLDAADIGSFKIAKAWLPDLDLKVEARAKAPHMRVTQLVDRQMAYQGLITGEADEQVATRSNQEKLARVILSRGPDGLVICPKRLRTAWEKAMSLPPGWVIWNFGAIRGLDEAREVPRLIIVSRPLPSPGDAEIMAETIFGRRVDRLPSEDPYPKTPVGRLMADGTGRRALALRHPDPLVEAVRFAICEGELLQAVGRGRGVRRTVESPLEVLILTNVPIPIPVDEVIAWRGLSDNAGPLDLLAAKGLVPLDYAGIAAVFPEWFGNAAKVRNWFQYRPEARARLRNIKRAAAEKGVVDACEFCGISIIESSNGDSTKLAAYGYRRGGLRQSNLVLVNDAVHNDARAAVEQVLGPLDDFQPISPRQRSRRRPSSSDRLSPAILAQLGF